MAQFLHVSVGKFAFTLACLAFVAMASTASAGFHLWHVKEVFSNADGSVQFVEMFDSFSNENFVTGFTLSSNSDGVIKNFVFPGDPDGNSANKHMLIATPGFGSLTGAVTPDFTFDQGGVVGAFFNPNAANITISFSGSGDSMAFTGAALPKNGINSLTDAGASGFPPGLTNISSGVNSPTNFDSQVRLGELVESLAHRRLQRQPHRRRRRLRRLAQHQGSIGFPQRQRRRRQQQRHDR